MADNPYVNKVQYDGNTLIDLTSDTVTAATLLSGYTAHIASGEIVTGTIANGDSIGYGVLTQPIVGTAKVGATQI